MFNLRELRHEVEDLFSPLSGIAEMAHPESEHYSPADLWPLQEGRAGRSCTFIPPRSAGRYYDPTERAAQAAERRAARPVRELTDEQRSARAEREAARRAAMSPKQRAAELAKNAERLAALSPEAKEARWRALEATRAPRPESYYEAKRLRERARYAAKISARNACA